MNLDDVFKSVAFHLKPFRIKCKWLAAPPGKLADVKKAEARIGLKFPTQLQKLYTKYADGVVFHWEKGDDFGGLALPSLTQIVKQFEDWKALVMWMENYDFPHVENRDLARKTYRSMKQWLPLHMHGNGDAFCLDCAAKGKPVRYHLHDWFDGGPGTNGHPLAPDLESFVRSWARVCFTAPRDLYWPNAFTADGMAWTEEHFDGKYILTP